MNKIIKYIKKPSNILLYLMNKNFFKWIPDEKYIKIKYKLEMDKKLNLKNPQTFNEKLQWLKLYDRKTEYTKMVDKYEAKKYVANIIGEEYIIPTLGVWDRFEDIDFTKLPNQFVLKPTHTSGNIFICKDKNKIDYRKLKREVNKWLKREYYYIHREWPYKDIKPRVIAEKYIENNDGKSINDYKFYCFNGKADYVLVCIDRNMGRTKFFFLNREGKLMKNYTKDAIKYDCKLKINLINNLDEMFKIAENLSKNLKFIRVDLYNANGKIYFGELTFFPDAGWDKNRLEVTDKEFTKRLNLR